MSVTDELLQNNEAYAATFNQGDLPMPPGRQLAVVACMDARLDVYRILGLGPGRSPRYPQRRRGNQRGRHPVAGDLPALVGHPGDHPSPPLRLRDAYLPRR